MTFDDKIILLQKNIKNKIWKKNQIEAQLKNFAISMLELKEHVEKYQNLCILDGIYKRYSMINVHPIHEWTNKIFRVQQKMLNSLYEERSHLMSLVGSKNIYALFPDIEY